MPCSGGPWYESDSVKNVMTRAGDDAERSDEEERRKIPAGDDAERSDEEERRHY